MSWYLVGHPYWKEGIQHLLPPVYADSPSYWEDAWIVNGTTPHFWSSPKLSLMQIVKSGYNLLKFFQAINELTAFFIIAIILAVRTLRVGRQQVPANMQYSVLCLSFLLFPIGYFLINFEARYLWYMLPLAIIIIVYALQSSAFFIQLAKSMQRFVLVVFALTIVAFPALGLKKMFNAGRHEWTMAQALRKHNISGSFTTNIPYSPQTQDIVRLSYFSGNPYYNMPLPGSKADLLKEMRRYKVKYYFHFYDTGWDTFQFTDENNLPFPEVSSDEVPGLKVFLITPATPSDHPSY
jgi:hypothetical protein